MDHELIAHLDRLSKLEVNASAQKKQDVIVSLRILEAYLIDEDEVIAADVVDEAITEIISLRRKLK